MDNKPGGAGEAMTSNDKQNEVVLVKGHHRWSFSGDPAEVSAYLDSLVADPEIPIDNLDATLVRHQLSRRQVTQ